MKHKEWILLLISGILFGGCGLTKNTLLYHEGTHVGLQIKANPTDTLEPLSVNLGLERTVVAIVPPACPYKDDEAGKKGDLTKACFQGNPPSTDDTVNAGGHSGEALSVLSLFDLKSKTIEGFTLYQNFASGEAANILSRRLDEDKKNMIGKSVWDAGYTPSDTTPNRGPGGRFGEFGVHKSKAVVAFDNDQNHFDGNKHNVYQVRLANLIALVKDDQGDVAESLKNEIAAVKEKVEKFQGYYKGVEDEIKKLEDSVGTFKSIFKSAKADVTSLFTHLEAANYDGIFIGLCKMFLGDSICGGSK